MKNLILVILSIFALIVFVLSLMIGMEKETVRQCIVAQENCINYADVGACEYIPNPFVGSYQFHTEADISTTKEMLGYEPRFEMEDGIRAYVGEIRRIYEQEVKK